ncbi:E3 ubiquitin-protein ligase TRIM71 [Holothuria leucospilota]|uniref:E3 ubiquitin-protein ligase TRIM71 n=1 Tax=Holothuria leucospilota TaxID=206669 RepID=A0A9Q1C3Z2_HOLLE|nr:E3 ubiquitin-protein ligase TRIM71 [Holothuria leucospilota]
MRKCFGCTNLLKVAAYCFRCNDFLCRNCYTFHMKNNTLKDHRQHTLSIDDAESKDFSMKKLVSLRDAPRCLTHPDKISDLCCNTCSNLPVCTSCTYGDHKNHNCLDIKTFAAIERNRATSAMQLLENVKQCKLAISPDEAIQKLLSNAETENENLRRQYDDEAQKLKSKLNEINKQKKALEDDKDDIKQTAFSSLRDEMEKEIQEIKSKYDLLTAQKDKEINDDFNNREDLLAKELHKFSTKLEKLDEVKSDLSESFQMELNKKVENIERCSVNFQNSRKRFNNLHSMISSVLVSENDWMTAVYTSDICIASAKLAEDIKALPDLETMSDVKIDSTKLTLRMKEKITVSENRSMLSADIEPLKGMCTINDISGGNNVMVITGEYILKKQSIIVVVDRNGSVLRQDTLRETSSLFHSRYCDFLSKFQVASVCEPHEIGVYDVRDGSYIMKNLREISSWPSGCVVSCVATDRPNNNIFVGGKFSRKVYVFDNKLRHQWVLELSESIKWPQNLAVYKSCIIVCDSDGKKAYEIIVDKSNVKETFELAKPDQGKVQLRPKSACRDSNGYIYVLWTSEKLFGRSHFVLAQYSRDDERRLIEARKLIGEPSCFSVLESRDEDVLLVGYFDTVGTYVISDEASTQNDEVLLCHGE